MGYQRNKKLHENEHTATQNLWYTAKAVLIALHAYCKKQEKSQINNLILVLKEL